MYLKQIGNVAKQTLNGFKLRCTSLDIKFLIYRLDTNLSSDHLGSSMLKPSGKSVYNFVDYHLHNLSLSDIINLR